jgi:hypothetical protein
MIVSEVDEMWRVRGLHTVAASIGGLLSDMPGDLAMGWG